jgi:hypothetical protein
LKIFKKAPKKDGDDIFDRLNVSTVAGTPQTFLTLYRLPNSIST